ncbi:MAG: hypothetical protein ACKN9D_02915 [Actinomycetales bacterium]
MAEIPLGSNPNLPATGLVPGGSVLLVNGQLVPVTVRPNSRVDPTSLVFQTQGLTLRMGSLGNTGNAMGVADQRVLLLQSLPLPTVTRLTAGGDLLLRRAAEAAQPVLVLNGDGFKPSSPVRVFLLPSVPVGEVLTDASGTLNTRLPIPAGIAPGAYTLQMNALGPDGALRSLNVGVEVRQDATTLLRQRATIAFTGSSGQLSNAAKRQLRQLSSRVPKDAVTAVTIAQQSSAASTNGALSRRRAAAIAGYLRSLGVTVAPVTTFRAPVAPPQSSATFVVTISGLR